MDFGTLQHKVNKYKQFLNTKGDNVMYQYKLQKYIDALQNIQSGGNGPCDELLKQVDTKLGQLSEAHTKKLNEYFIETDRVNNIHKSIVDRLTHLLERIKKLIDDKNKCEEQIKALTPTPGRSKLTTLQIKEIERLTKIVKQKEEQINELTEQIKTMSTQCPEHVKDLFKQIVDRINQMISTTNRHVINKISTTDIETIVKQIESSLGINSTAQTTANPAAKLAAIQNPEYMYAAAKPAAKPAATAKSSSAAAKPEYIDVAPAPAAAEPEYIGVEPAAAKPAAPSRRASIGGGYRNDFSSYAIKMLSYKY